jgi:hypothetical protein
VEGATAENRLVSETSFVCTRLSRTQVVVTQFAVEGGQERTVRGALEVRSPAKRNQHYVGPAPAHIDRSLLIRP